MVQELAARLHRSDGEPVPERDGLDRAPRRQPVLRRRNGERGVVDGRQPGGRGEEPGARLQRVPDDRERAVGESDPPQPAGHLPAARRRRLGTEPGGQEAGRRSRSPRPRQADIDRRHRHQWRLRGARIAGRCRRSLRAEANRSSRRRTVVQVRTGALHGCDCEDVVSIRGSGDCLERVVGRGVGQGRHDLCRQARLEDCGIVAFGERGSSTVPEPPGLQSATEFRQTIAAGSGAGRACAGRNPARAVIQPESLRAARSTEPGNERAVIGRPVQRHGRRGSGGAGPVGGWIPVHTESRSVAVAERPETEERYHRRCASQPAGREARRR